LLDAALSYSSRGWSVIPLLPCDKKPAISWEAYQRERASEEQIRCWWGKNPACNIGVVTGAVSGLVVLDLNGSEGRESVKLLDLPLTPIAATGRGQHWYFRHPGGKVGNAVKLLPGVDLRGDGGYVVAPPSIHPSGAEHRWLGRPSPEEADLVPLPEWVLDKQHDRQDGAEPTTLSEPVAEGARNQTLTSLAGSLRRRGADEATIFAALQAVNTDRCRPPLPEAEVGRIASSIAKYPAGGTQQQVSPDTVHETDLGNAQRLVALHGQDLRYCHPWNKWLVWDGTRWSQDATAEAVRRAKDVVRAMYAEAASQLDDDRRKSLAKHAWKTESESRIEAMLSLARSEPGIPILPEQLDTNSWLLNCANGTLDVRTGELRPHKREDLLTRKIPVAYDPNATCPEWYRFLDRIMAGRAGLVSFLQRAPGYSLTGCTDERVLFLLHGRGANGKTTFLETVALLLGDYAMRTTIETLLARGDRDGIPNDVARLRGARFVYASEAEEGRRLAEAKLKDITGGDTIAARFLHAE